MRINIRKYITSKQFVLVVGVLAGALAIMAIRFVTYKPDLKIHYHANFAVYLNGQREQFKAANYYTETEMCTNETGQDANMPPTERAHMHDNVNSVVHVEDHAVTWGQFFQNLGWNFGENYLIDNNGTVYTDTDHAKMHVILNGQDYTGLGNMAARVIKDQDRLLLSYGSETDSQVMQEFSTVPSTAHRYDVTPDAKSCSGHDEDSSMRARIKHMF